MRYLSTILIATVATTANAATIYSEPIDGIDVAVSTLGWSGYTASGADLTNSVTSPMYILDAQIFIGFNNTGGQYVAITDAPTIDPTAYQDLTISFNQNATDADPLDPGMGWRILAEVGGSWYASDFAPYTFPAITTISAKPSDAIWHLWTGETDLTNGFDVSNIAAPATVLAAGDISGVAVLAIDGVSGNDRMRLLDLAITATDSAVPEPSTLFLAAFGLLGLIGFGRRRKR